MERSCFGLKLPYFCQPPFPSSSQWENQLTHLIWMQHDTYYSDGETYTFNISFVWGKTTYSGHRAEWSLAFLVSQTRSYTFNLSKHVPFTSVSQLAAIKASLWSSLQKSHSLHYNVPVINTFDGSWVIIIVWWHYQDGAWMNKPLMKGIYLTFSQNDCLYWCHFFPPYISRSVMYGPRDVFSNAICKSKSRGCPTQ